jgi:Kef-type K+ transport system membrane component KefB
MMATLAAAPVGLPPDLVGAYVLADLAIILVAARLVGAAARRLGQPTVVGEILAGVLLGPSLLGPDIFRWDRPWAALRCDDALAVPGADGTAPSLTTCLFPPQARPSLALVGQIALILYMFLVGLELDQRAVRRGGLAVLSVAAGATAIPLAMGVALGPMLYNDTFVGPGSGGEPPSRLGFGLMVGAILAVTALPVMARILEERELSATRLGTLGIASAAAVTVLMFLAIATARDVAEGRGLGPIALRWVGAALFVVAMLGPVRAALVPAGEAIERRGELGSTAFAGLLVFVLAASVVADRLGLNVIPGAFIAGAVLPARDLLRRELGDRLREVTVVVLLPVFLAYSGLNTNFGLLGWSALGGVVVLLAAAVAGKWLGGAVGARLGGLRGDDTHALGVLMSCRGLLVLVAALVALESGVISPTLQVSGVLIALVTTVMTAPLLERFLPPAPAVDVTATDPQPTIEHERERS